MKILTEADGIASPTSGPFIMVLIPTTSPRLLTTAPPEWPGRRCSPRASIGPDRPIKVPAVAAPGTPQGFPTAITQSPGRSAVESPTTATLLLFELDLEHGQVQPRLALAPVRPHLRTIRQTNR